VVRDDLILLCLNLCLSFCSGLFFFTDEPLTPAHFRDSNTQLDSFRNAHTQLGRTQPESMTAEPLEDKAVALVQAINDPEVSLQTLMSQAQGLTLEQLQTALKFHENVKSGAVQTLNARNASRLAREQEKVLTYSLSLSVL
jgi:hypothetical protein